MGNNKQDLSIDKLGRQARLTQENLKQRPTPTSCRPNEPKPYLIRKIKNGHPYYYRAVMVRENGKRKQKILAYLGTRKPRDYKEFTPKRPRLG